MPIHHLDAAIIFPTSYFKSGWGSRVLNNIELAKCFGLPSSLQVRTLTPQDFKFVPCQILESLLSPVFQIRIPQEYASLKRKEFNNEHIEFRITYFSTIQKHYHILGVLAWKIQRWQQNVMTRKYLFNYGIKGSP